jgi:hypothetical protein
VRRKESSPGKPIITSTAEEQPDEQHWPTEVIPMGSTAFETYCNEGFHSGTHGDQQGSSTREPETQFETSATRSHVKL